MTRPFDGISNGVSPIPLGSNHMIAGRNRWKAITVGLLLVGVLSDRIAQASASCDRECLRVMTKKYVEALASHDVSRLPLSETVRATENTKPIKPGDGIWKTAIGIGPYRIFVQDPLTGQAAFMGVVREDSGATMLVVRIKVQNAQIVEIETIVTRAGFPGPAALAPAALLEARRAFEDPVSADARQTREQLIARANSYYDGIEQNSFVPFARDCQRIENGVAVTHNPQFNFSVVSPSGRQLPNFAAMGCAEQFKARLWGTDTITHRHFPVVDPEHGVALVISSYNVFVKGSCADSPLYGRVCPEHISPPVSLNVAELFKIRSGQIHEIESIWTAVPYPTDTGW
jgi:hypothetical protein